MACREYKIDTAEDTVLSLKRELKLKEVLLLEKTALAIKFERDADDAVRTAKENERDYEEVCVLYVLCVTVLFRPLGRFMVVRKVVMTMDIRLVCMCV